MEQITLTLAPRHLRPLRHICKANYESIMADPEASREAREIAADIYRRVLLLDNAVNALEIAVNTRAKYDRYISNGKRVTVHANAPRKPAQIDTNDNAATKEKPLEQAQEPPEATEEATDEKPNTHDPDNNTSIVKRPF